MPTPRVNVNPPLAAAPGTPFSVDAKPHSFWVEDCGFCADARPAHTGASLPAAPCQIPGTCTPTGCAGRAARCGTPLRFGGGRARGHSCRSIPRNGRKSWDFDPPPRLWLTFPMPCSHLPPLCTAGNVRPRATFEHAAGWMRAREEEQQARVWGKVGSTEHSSCVRRGCTWGQRSSQRADAGEPWAHRATHALACPTARGGWHVVAVCGRPGHICARIRVGGVALLRLRAGWDRIQPEYTPSSHAPLDSYGCLVRAVHRVYALTRNDTRDM